MKHQKENYFKSKFILLNSQADSQEIIWSCSDSSEYENSHSEINVKAVKRKRKRVKGKKKLSNNISNLDITFVDVTLEKNNEKNVEKSRNRSNTDNFTNLSNVGCKSPILSSQRYVAPLKRRQSTVNRLSPSDRIERKPTSPVLVLKCNTPKNSPKIRKKLFNNNANTSQDTCREIRSSSPVLTCVESRLRKIDNHKDGTIDISKLNKDICQINTYRENNTYDSSLIKVQPTYKNNNNYNNEEIPLTYKEKQTCNNNINLDDTLTDKTTSVVLVEKVKLYFDSYFSPTTNSQHSISEYESKSSPSNDDIEIINSLPETRTSQSLKSDNKSSDSLKFDDIPQTKKVKYKKDGLAYRLSALIKKQNANTSLWYHERFLAANSNFVLPQEQFLALRIQEVSFKYGCFLLKALNVNDNTCIIIINNLYAKSNIFKENFMLKLYKPYKIIDFESYQLIINVCKYECILLKN
ncbi:GATOR complex protein WDR24-like [Vanessa cardui]|uniref:GATOR complex protein WDR24-like n=1 Tax=Vanessa cardui TaxID=171605 RepID=UPI001F13FF7A|nr:GATOR complex protein WDR24-like [Vanessa cardui]